MEYFKAPGIFVSTNTDQDRQAISPLSMNSNLVGFLGIAERGEINTPTYIRSFKEYTDYFGSFNTTGMLPHSVQSFFKNGGEHCIVIRTARVEDVKCASLKLKADNGEMLIKTKTPGVWGNNIHFSLWKENDKNFSISFMYDGAVENYLHLSYNKEDPRYFKNYINKFSSWCEVDTTGKINSFDPVILSRFAGGNDGLDNITPRDFLGKYTNPNDNYGIATFEKYDDMTLVAIPDVQALKVMDDVITVQKVTTMFAETKRDRFVILDVPERLAFQDIKTWSGLMNTHTAAGYYPNILVNNPNRKKDGKNIISIPPSGAICGIISNTDRMKGPHIPPSGSVINGALDTSRRLNLAEQEIVFASSVNYLKFIRGNGVRVWGARTLSTEPGSTWQHINVRRAFSRICKFLKYNTEWAVFENNNAELMKSLVYSVQSFLTDLFRKGYFAGESMSDAFYVYCGEENNPIENIDRGIITIDVGVALVKPTEFFNIRMSSNKETGGITFGGN